MPRGIWRYLAGLSYAIGVAESIRIWPFNRVHKGVIGVGSVNQNERIGKTKLKNKHTIYLVDGTYEVFRAYYGGPSLLNSNGQEVGAVRTFLYSMYKLLREKQVTHIGCAFDHTIESFRNQLFADYKNGDGIDASFWYQLHCAELCADALGILVWPMVDYEADDALATACYQLLAGASVTKIDQIILATPDKDLAQMVTHHKVIQWDRMRDIRYDSQKVLEKFGVYPQSIPDLLALVGDSADGIPGIPGWGMKSARMMLNHYRCIEAIPQDSGEWQVPVRGKKRLEQSLRDHSEQLQLYKRLATLITDCPIATALSDLQWQGVSLEKLSLICQEVEDEKLLGRIQADLDL